MLHLYAALAEKERRLISERTSCSDGQEGERYEVLGNPSNIREAGEAGRTALIEAPMITPGVSCHCCGRCEARARSQSAPSDAR